MELIDAINDLYVDCPSCATTFRVDKGNPRTSEQYKPSFMELQAKTIDELSIEWTKKVSDARTHQRTIGIATALEQLAPLLPRYPRDFRDARFIGGLAPCDIMSLDGYAGGETKSLTFIEVKTGKTTRLKKTEKQFKEVIEKGNVSYETLHIPFDALTEYLKGAPVTYKKG